MQDFYAMLIMVHQAEKAKENKDLSVFEVIPKELYKLLRKS